MENELKKMANFNKKRKQGRGWWVNLDAGDVPKANTFFNSVSGSEPVSVGESLGKGKDEIFTLIKEINPNAKEENYRDKDVNQMLSILFDMRKRRRNYDKDRFEERPFTGVERDLEDGQLYHYNNDIKGEVATEEESEPEYWREGKTMNIREELNRLDWEHIDEGFDLRNLYCAREWSKDDKKKIATMICNGNITKLHDFLNESLNESVSNGTDILLKEVKLALSKLNIPYESICTEGVIYQDYEANVVVSNHEREYSKDEIEAVKDECEHCGDASYGLTCGYWENKYSMLFYTLANSKNVREGYDDFKSYPEFQEEYHKLKDGRQGYFVVRDNNNKEFVRTTYEPEAKEVQERHPGSWIDFVEVDKDNVDEALYINQPDRKIWKTVRGAIKATKDDDIDYQADNVMDNLYDISDRKLKEEKENDVLRKGLFEVVDMNPDEPFVGYTKDEHWQIWDVPYFEKETVLELNKKYVKSGDEFDLLYDAKRDGFIEIVYGKGLHFFKGFVAETEDGKKKLYGIGAWEWLWSEVEPKEDEDGTYYATIR